MKRIVIGGVSSKDYEGIQKTAQELGLVCECFSNDDLEKTIQEILSRPMDSSFKENDIKAVMLFDQVENKDITQLIKNLEKEENPFEGVLGVVNENNLQWKLSDLLMELNQEYLFFKDVEKLKSQITELNQHSLSDLEIEEKRWIVDAFLFSNDPQPEELKDHLDKLEKLLNKFK